MMRSGSLHSGLAVQPVQGHRNNSPSCLTRGGKGQDLKACTPLVCWLSHIPQGREGFSLVYTPDVQCTPLPLCTPPAALQAQQGCSTAALVKDWRKIFLSGKTLKAGRKKQACSWMLDGLCQVKFTKFTKFALPLVKTKLESVTLICSALHSLSST